MFLPRCRQAGLVFGTIVNSLTSVNQIVSHFLKCGIIRGVDNFRPSERPFHDALTLT